MSARNCPATGVRLTRSEHQKNLTLSILDHGTRRQSPHRADRTTRGSAYEKLIKNVRGARGTPNLGASRSRSGTAALRSAAIGRPALPALYVRRWSKKFLARSAGVLSAPSTDPSLKVMSMRLTIMVCLARSTPAVPAAHLPDAVGADPICGPRSFVT